jgi:hypothetical protein
MVEINDALTDGQADAGSVRPTPGGIFYLLKFFKYFILVPGPDANAVVLYIDLYLLFADKLFVEGRF